MSESEKEKILARLKTLSKPSQIAVLLAMKEAKQEQSQEEEMMGLEVENLSTKQLDRVFATLEAKRNQKKP